MSTIHIPVMLSEVIEGLNLNKGDTIVDATLGGGGHALGILKRILPDGRLFAFDADETAIVRFRDRLEHERDSLNGLRDGSVALIHRQFSDIGEALRDRGISSVSGIVADLGFSSDQLDDPARGFSFLREGPLDMRLDQSDGETAGKIVNTWSEGALAEIFREYGDVRDAGRMARAIGTRRKERTFETTTEFADFVKSVSRDRRASIHPATKIFQALRIAVNHERASLEKFLYDAIGLLKEDGRIAVLSFHSGEERTVKRIFAEDARGCVCPREFPVCRCGRKVRLNIITKRAIVPSDRETRENPRARSAKLRIAERISGKKGQ